MSKLVKEYAKEFATLPTSAVSTALDRLGIKGQCMGLRALDRPAARLCGRAFTVQFLSCGPPDARTPNGDIGDYIEDVPAGYVVALDNRGNQDSSVWDAHTPNAWPTAHDKPDPPRIDPAQRRLSSRVNHERAAGR